MRELALALLPGDQITATLWPLSADGTILVGSVVRLRYAREGRRSPALAVVALLAGGLASLAGNTWSGAPDPAAMAVSAWPSIALFLSVEVHLASRRDLARALEPARVMPSQSIEPAGADEDQGADDVAAVRRLQPVTRKTSPKPKPRRPVDPIRVHELAAQGMSVRAIARELGCHPSTVSRRLGAAAEA
jgi:hypothetical protein